MQAALPQHAVHGVPVPHGLHLKSACTAFDSRTMVYADNEAGRGLKQLLQEHPAFSTGSSSSSSFGSSCSSGHSSGDRPWRHVLVAPECCNLVLLEGGHVVMQTGRAKSEQLLEQLAVERGLQLHKLPYDEFAKADGALTCCSILLPGK